MKATLKHMLGTVEISTDVPTHPDKPVNATYSITPLLPGSESTIKKILVRELHLAIGLYGHTGVHYDKPSDTFQSTNMDLYVALQGLDGFTVEKMTKITPSKMPEGVLT